MLKGVVNRAEFDQSAEHLLLPMRTIAYLRGL
jgi:hypothetical protein